MQRRMDRGPHSALLSMPFDLGHCRSDRRSSRDRAGDYGACRDPATLTYRAGQRAGEWAMFRRDGLWWAPEMTDEEKVAAAGERAS